MAGCLDGTKTKARCDSLTIMTSSLGCGWQNLPDFIFSDIMIMVQLESFEVFKKCKQVCQSWNAMISKITKHKKNTIWRQAEILVARIREKWVFDPDSSMEYNHYPCLPEITAAADLAHHGILDSVDRMWLEDVDLASVPAEHLASLASSVKWHIEIVNVRIRDLSPILASVQCPYLWISAQSLGSEETKALVGTMESTVEELVLGYEGEVSLDIKTLTQYTGGGKCQEVRPCCFKTRDKYWDELRGWTQRNHWVWWSCSCGCKESTIMDIDRYTWYHPDDRPMLLFLNSYCF